MTKYLPDTSLKSIEIVREKYKKIEAERGKRKPRKRKRK